MVSAPASTTFSSSSLQTEHQPLLILLINLVYGEGYRHLRLIVQLSGLLFVLCLLICVHRLSVLRSIVAGKWRSLIVSSTISVKPSTLISDTVRHCLVDHEALVDGPVPEGPALAMYPGPSRLFSHENVHLCTERICIVPVMDGFS